MINRQKRIRTSVEVDDLLHCLINFVLTVCLKMFFWCFNDGAHVFSVFLV